MPVILSLETSTDVCSVALHDESNLLAEQVLQESQAHAARLAPLIDKVIRTSGLVFKDIDAVAISMGPGSYTGLRIGTSTAKGLCYALDIPLIAIGTLELMAFQGVVVSKADALLCPMIDARRMEVYCLVADQELAIIEEVSARVVDEATFAELLELNKVLFFGNGAGKCKTVINHSNASFLEGISPMAGALGEMARRKFASEEFEDLVGFKPFYLKEFVAKKPGMGNT